MEFRQKWPLTKESIIQVAGLWRLVLPDDKHPKVVMKELDHQFTFLHVDKWTRIEGAESVMREMNEWKRQRGGRQKIKPEDKLKPSEYLHGDEVQHSTTSQ